MSRIGARSPIRRGSRVTNESRTGPYHCVSNGVTATAAVTWGSQTGQSGESASTRQSRFTAAVRRAVWYAALHVRRAHAPKLQVQIDEDISQGVYSNLVLLNHTENEFVLDFAFIQPSNGRAKVRSRVISSPRHTKRLLQALQKNLERYEERFERATRSSGR